MSDDWNGPEQTFRDTERNLRNLIEAQAAEIVQLSEVLRAFTDCARYDPHMDGSSSFMGWRHSELRRVEELARATLAALENKP